MKKKVLKTDMIICGSSKINYQVVQNYFNSNQKLIFLKSDINLTQKR